MPVREIPSDADYFRDVRFLVEASDYERLSLFRDYHYQPRANDVVVRSWEQELAGWMVQIGTVRIKGKDWPINVSLSYAKLNGHRVLFYEGCSAVVHYFMIEEWLKKHTLESIRWANGSRWAHSNAMNFHLCLDALGILDEWRRAKSA